MLGRTVIGVLLLLGCVGAGLVQHLRMGRVESSSRELVLQLLDSEGVILAGVEISKWNERGELQLLGISDAYGGWRGKVQQDEMLFLRKQSSLGVYATTLEVAKARSIVRLPRQQTSGWGRNSLEFQTPERALLRVLLRASSKAGLQVGAKSRVLVEIVKQDKHYQVRAHDRIAGSDIFAFQVRAVAALVRVARKILQGVYQHMQHAYTVFYGEEDSRWYVYNPHGFWRLRAGMKLISAGGNEHELLTGGEMRLALEGENICSAAECQLYSSPQGKSLY